MKNLFDHLIRRWFVYPLADRHQKRSVLPQYREAVRIARMPAATRDALSLARLHAVIETAALKVPYYKALFTKAGVTPSQIKTWEDLPKIPALSKQAVLEAGDSLVNPTLRREFLHQRQTGGSTGPAMKVWYDTPALDASSGIDKRCLEWMGYRLGEKMVHVVNRDPNPANPISVAYEKKKFWAVNYERVWIDRLDDAKLAALMDALDDIRAKWLNAYPSVLHVLAQYAAAKGRRPRRRWGAVTTGETLFESQRQAITKNLGIEIFNRYGSAEFGVIAHECRAHAGLHINEDHVHVELEPVPGETGVFEVLVTTLTNHAMPLIRYRTGDLCYGALDRTPCRCGLTLPRLPRVEGRVHDVLYTPGGGRLLSSFIQDSLLGLGGVRQFQLVQQDFDHIQFRYLPDFSMTPQILDRIRTHLQKNLGEAVRIDFVETPEMTTSREGKLRYTNQSPEFKEKLKLAAVR